MTRLLRAIEVPAYVVASGLNFAAYVFFMLFTDRSATVYIVAALVFLAMVRIVWLQRRLDAQEAYWSELTAALRGHLERNATRD